MLDPSVPLVTFSHGQGGGHHQSPTRTVSPDGQRVLDWAKTLPARQHVAVATAFTRLGLQVNDFFANKADYNGIAAGNAPPRYDFFTGMYYDYGQGNDGVQICTDQSLLVQKPAKGDHPAHK